VDVPVLGDAGAVARRLSHVVCLDDRHGTERRTEGLRRQESGHTPADHDRAAAWHHSPITRLRQAQNGGTADGTLSDRRWL
jgi:hypothetical protein